MKPELELHIQLAIRLYEQRSDRRVCSLELTRGGDGVNVRIHEIQAAVAPDRSKELN